MTQKLTSASSETQDEITEGIVLPLDEAAVNERVKDFSELLDEIDSLGDKKKRLWREIYEHAIVDRQNAYALFIELCRIVKDKSAEHAIHGRTISSFLERMSKSNEQLIRLAELIAKAERKTDDIDPEDLFDQINKKR